MGRPIVLAIIVAVGVYAGYVSVTGFASAMEAQTDRYEQVLNQ